jgi:hypothetical protein
MARLWLVAVVWGLCAFFSGVALFIFSAPPKRPDLYGLAIWPMVTAAVIATPFALFA